MRTLDLPSGMRIVLEVDHTRPLVGIASVVDCGAAQDPIGHEGLAHLVEHLTFRAQQQGKLQLSNLLEFQGAGDWNGFTEHDLTTYYEVGAREALSSLLHLEGARLSEPLAGIEENVFEAEREVVRNELLQRDENGLVTAAVVTLGAALYPAGHPYARSILGTEASLWSLTLADAKNFVLQCYQPRNYTVVIAGDFDPAKIGGILDGSFPARFLEAPAGGAVKPRSRLDPVAPRPPEPSSDASIHWVKAPAESPKLYIGWALPRGFDTDGYAESFLARSLTALAMRGALEDDIVSIRPSFRNGKFGTTLTLTVLLRTGSDPKRSAAHVLHAVPALMNLSKEWLTQTWSYALVDFARTADSFDDRLVQRAQLFHLTGDPLTSLRELQSLEKLDRGQLDNLAFYWLNEGRARVVFLKPDDWEPAGRTAGGSPHVFAPSDSLPMKLDPSALKTYVHGPGFPMHTVVLDTGLEVVLVRRPGLTSSVTVAVRSGSATATPLGVADVSDSLSGTLSLFGAPADSGIRLFSRNEPDATVVQAVGASENLEKTLKVTLLQLTGLHVADPLPQFWTRDVLPVLKEFELKSSSRADRALFENTFADSSYPRMPGVADYQKLSASDVKSWIERAYRPANSVAIVVSDLEPSKAEELARRAFGQWKGPSAPPDAPFVAPITKTGPVRTFRVERPGAKQTELILGCAAHPKDARDALAFKLLGARLQNRLRSFARGRSGGSYSVSAEETTSRQLSNIKVWGFVDDRNLTRVLALARKELDELRALNVSDDELGGMKWRLGIQTTVGYGASEELGSLLAEVRAANLPLALVEKFPEVLEAVGAEDVRRMAAACRTTATLGLVGDPALMERAFRATGNVTASAL
ncbi:MAG: M16 family metallopeptidase [Myxococcaceae bacterium]